MPADTPTERRPSVDVRTLNLVQLQRLADAGSRRARAELQRRMTAADQLAAPTLTDVPTRLPPVAEIASAPAAPPAAPRPAALAASVQAAAQATAAADAPAPTPHPNDALAERLAMLARQDDASARVSGPPRLVGLVLLGAGGVLALGSLLVLLGGSVSGLFYLYCGAAIAAVGWLLYQMRHMAFMAHGVFLLLGLGWAWWVNGRSLLLAVVQLLPLLVAAGWMLAPPVRDPLE